MIAKTQARSPFTDTDARTAAGVHGLRLFLVSLGILFGSSLIAYLTIRFQAAERFVAEVPPLPWPLWVSTTLLLASSGTVQLARVAAQRERHGLLRTAMTLTLVLGLSFLAIQTACWILWAGPLTEALERAEVPFLVAGFFVLTGLHALHVIGGLIPMAVVTHRASRGGYTPADHAGVLYCAMYWHFLDGVWLVLFLTLLI